jgi:hypothetical protein
VGGVQGGEAAGEGSSCDCSVATISFLSFDKGFFSFRGRARVRCFLDGGVIRKLSASCAQTMHRLCTIFSVCRFGRVCALA